MNITDKLKALPGRFYRRGMSVKSILNNVIEYVGDQRVLYGCFAISVFLFIVSLILFAAWFAVLVFILSIPVLIVIAKTILYKPKKSSD